MGRGKMRIDHDTPLLRGPGLLDSYLAAHSLVEEAHSLVEDAHNLVEVAHSLVEVSHS